MVVIRINSYFYFLYFYIGYCKFGHKYISMKNFLFVFIALFGCNVLAQDEIILNEKFDHYKHGWNKVNNDKQFKEVSGGEHTIQSKDGKSVFSYIPSNINPEKDYYIETNIAFVSGSGYQYGIILLDMRKSKAAVYYHYCISSDGKFNVWYDAKTKIIKDIVENRESKEIILGKNKYNKLAIQQKGTKTIFFINDKNVFELSESNFYGNKVGFRLFKQQKIKVDNLLIKQEKDKVNIFENLEFKKENLGTNINTKYSDKIPIVSADESTLYYAMYDKTYETFKHQEVYFSKINSKGKFGKAQNIGRPINNGGHNYVLSVSADNNTLIIGNLYNSEGEYDGTGLSISNRTKSGWSFPKKIEIENHYNNNGFFGGTMSADRKTILLTVEREDSFGGLDIYMCSIKPDGTWTEPSNLGPKINTYEGESSPSLAPDGKTLYFASRGLPGYGDYDIFMAKRLDDSWTNWSEPVNLGPGINGEYYDGTFKIDAKGKFAYTISTEDAIGQFDIFRVNVPEQIKPNASVLVKGVITDKISGDSTEAEILYYKVGEEDIKGMARSSPVDGAYCLLLEPGFKFDVLISKDGYDSFETVLDYSDISNNLEEKQNFAIEPNTTRKEPQGRTKRDRGDVVF